MRPTIKLPVRRVLKLDGPYVKEFWNFHQANPGIYQILVKNARRAKERGRDRIGIRMLWEVMRWEMMMATVDPSQEEYKLNDHYTRHYARLIMYQESELKDIFEVRDQNRRP